MRQRKLGRAAGAGLLATVAAIAASPAQEVSQLRGAMFIAGRTAVDPPPEEAKNSHAYLTLSGAAALRMYRAMTAKEEPNLCEQGKRMKRAGALTCSLARDGRQAACDFSVDLIKGSLDGGKPC